MKTCEVAILIPVLFILGCGQDRPITGLPEVTSSTPARPQSSKIAGDTFGCRTIELSDAGIKTLIDKKPLPQGCFDLEPLLRVRGPFELRRIKSGGSDLTYALIEVPQKGRLWVLESDITVFPDGAIPSSSGQALRITAEEFVRRYNDAKYQGEQVIVTGMVRFANSQRIEMQTSNSTVLDFSSSGLSGIAEFPLVRQGQKVTIKGNCIGPGVKDKHTNSRSTARFFFQNCSIVPAAKSQE